MVAAFAFAVGTLARASASAAPHILATAATPVVVHEGDAVTWKVRTTPEVVGVDARIGFYNLHMNRLAPGRFTLAFRVPHGVPFWFHRVYSVTVTARDANGTTDSRSFPFDFQ